MPKADESLTQLSTRIPKDIHRRLKLYCVDQEIALMDFVTAAIQEKLARREREPKKRR